jgi:hypothetical protein
MKVIETTADDLMKILKAGGVMTNAFVRGLHNLAVCAVQFERDALGDGN